MKNVFPSGLCISSLMASMRQLFPSYNPRLKTQRNFIKENIRNAKGCNQCVAEKEELDAKNKTQNSQKIRSTKSKSESDLNRPDLPVVKCNMKIVNRAKSSTLNKKNDDRHISRDKIRNSNCVRKLQTGGKCQTCGQVVISENVEKSTCSKEEDHNDVSEAQNKHYHKLSHEKEINCKKDPPNKSLDLSSYQKGKVPRYLQVRIARLMKEEEERKEQEKLAEKLGLNDPRCPPGHMLMPPQRLKENLVAFYNQYQSLIKELNTMPITRDSFRIRNRKIEIEKNLKELDDKISLYESGKVFIKIPE